MAAIFTAQEILDLAPGRLASGMLPEGGGAICTDTRRLQEGEWFLALNGQHYDGHDFLGDAFSAGAIGCIVNERADYALPRTQFPLIAVSDTQDAHYELAASWRRRVNCQVILVAAGDDGVSAREAYLKGDQVSKQNHGTVSGSESESMSKYAAILCAQRSRDLYGDRTMLLEAADDSEILPAILAMDEDIKIATIEYRPRRLTQVPKLAQTLAPNAVLLSPGTFAHLRLNHTAENVELALASLQQSCLDNGGKVMKL